jgi:hypothetical protein
VYLDVEKAKIKTLIMMLETKAKSFAFERSQGSDLELDVEMNQDENLGVDMRYPIIPLHGDCSPAGCLPYPRRLGSRTDSINACRKLDWCTLLTFDWVSGCRCRGGIDDAFGFGKVVMYFLEMKSLCANSAASTSDCSSRIANTITSIVASKTWSWYSARRSSSMADSAAGDDCCAASCDDSAPICNESAPIAMITQQLAIVIVAMALQERSHGMMIEGSA